MSSKAPIEPVWWKNTFFVFGFLLVLLALLGLVKGEQAIRDPGQKYETGLVLFYFLGGVAMLVNGWMTHSQSVQQFEEYVDEHGVDSVKTSKKKPEALGDGNPTVETKELVEETQSVEEKDNG